MTLPDELLTIHEESEALFRLNVRLARSHCFYCGVSVTRELDARGKLKPTHYTNDHIHPRAKATSKLNGTHMQVRHPHGGYIVNYVTCCYRCNSYKGSLDIEEWRLVFFGGHGGKFWGERLLNSPDCVRFLDVNVDYQSVPPPIPEAL